MVRSKIRYELIVDDRTRRETFKKRKSGLLKKLSEFKTLCNVEACGILISGDGMQSDVWPSPHEASEVIQKFINLPTSSRTNNMTDQAGFLKQHLARLSKNLDKENMKVRSLERDLLLVECLTEEKVDVNNSKELHDMLRLLEKKIGMLDRKIAEIEPSRSNKVVGSKERNVEPQHGKGKRPL